MARIEMFGEVGDLQNSQETVTAVIPRLQTQGGRFAKDPKLVQEQLRPYLHQCPPCNWNWIFYPTVVCFTCTGTPSDVANKSRRLTHTHTHRKSEMREHAEMTSRRIKTSCH